MCALVFRVSPRYFCLWVSLTISLVAGTGCSEDPLPPSPSPSTENQETTAAIARPERRLEDLYKYRSETLECPLPKYEYIQVREALANFKNEILEPEKCKNLKDQFTDLEVFYEKDAKNFLDYFKNRGDDDTELDAEEAEALTSYSERLGGKVTSFLFELTRSGECVSESSKESTLSTVASITQEVTSVAAQFSGPYSLPIAIGGNLFAGILRAIDGARKKNYNFDNPKHRELYIRSICIYHDIKSEVDGILDPEARMKLVGSLLNELQTKKRKIEGLAPGQCSNFHQWKESKKFIFGECKAVRQVLYGDPWLMQSGALPIDLSGNTWARCLDLSDLVHGVESPIQRISDELSYTQNFVGSDASRLSAIHRVLKSLNSETGVPSAEACLSEKDEKTLEKTNRRSEALIVAAIDRSEKFYLRTLDSLVRKATSVNDIDGQPFNPLDWLRNTLKKMKWAKSEQKRLKKLMGNHSASARYDITELQQGLHERLFKVLSPAFLTWHLEQSQSMLAAFQKATEQADKFMKRTVLPHMEALRITPRGPSHLVAKQITKNEDLAEELDHQHIYAELALTLPPYDRARFASDTITGYCEYFGEAGTLVDEIHEVCEDPDFKQHKRRLINAKDMAQHYGIYFDWCHEKKRVRADWLKGLERKIAECHLDLPDVTPQTSGQFD